MSNIRVDVGYTIKDGTEIKFRSPVDCSAITGLIVYYPGSNGNITSKVFAFADAHGNNVGDIDHLFAENVFVNVILDVTTSMAFVQNADTNAYLEAQLAGKAPAGYGLGGTTSGILDCNITKETGWYQLTSETANAPVGSGFMYGLMQVIKRKDCQVVQIAYATYDQQNITAIRTCFAWSGEGEWTEWEYVNPPMFPGVEYRTTKRWNGKAVYQQLLAAGSLPGSGSTHLDIPTSGTIDTLISASGCLPVLKKVFPSSVIAGSMKIDIETSADGVDVHVSHDWLGGAQFNVTVEYTLV